MIPSPSPVSAPSTPGGYFFVAACVRGVERSVHPTRFASATEAAKGLRVLFADEEDLAGLPVQGPYPSRRAAWDAFDTATNAPR